MDFSADGVLAARSPNQEKRSGSIPTSALQLWVHRISFIQARRLNEQWHSVLPRIGDPANCMAKAPCFAASFDDEVYAVAIWSHPVNRSLPQNHWLELRRLAVSAEAPRNTASRMLAIMTKLLRKQFPEIERLISYQDTERHTGCIYRAAGWIPTVLSKWNDWNKPNSRNLNGRPRTRPASQSKAPKQRWELVLS